MKNRRIIVVRIGVASVGLGIGLAWWTSFSDVEPATPATPAVHENPARVTEDAAIAAQAESLRKTTRDQKPGAVTDDQIRRLMTEWARQDPEAALKFAIGLAQDETDDGFFRAADIAFRAWAEKQPEQARAYLEDISDNARVTAKLAPVLLRIYAERSPHLAQDWLRTGFVDDSGDLRPVLASELTTILVKKGRRADVEAWLAVTDVAEAAYALPAVDAYSRELAARDVQAALAFSEKLPRGTLSRGLAIQNAFHAWATRDADQSHDWINGLIAREEVRPILQNSNFPAEPDPAPAVAPGAYTADELDYAISGYVLALARTSPKEALEEAMSIQDFSLRRKIQEEVNALAPETPAGTGS